MWFVKIVGSIAASAVIAAVTVKTVLTVLGKE